MHTHRKTMKTARHGNCIFLTLLDHLLLHFFIALE
jgi:hypothetical protein